MLSDGITAVWSFWRRDVRWRTRDTTFPDMFEHRERHKTTNVSRNVFKVRPCFRRTLQQEQLLRRVCRPRPRPVILSVTLQPPTFMFCEGPALHSAPTLPLAGFKIKLRKLSNASVIKNSSTSTSGVWVIYTQPSHPCFLLEIPCQRQACTVWLDLLQRGFRPMWGDGSLALI